MKFHRVLPAIAVSAMLAAALPLTVSAANAPYPVTGAYQDPAPNPYGAEANTPPTSLGPAEYAAQQAAAQQAAAQQAAQAAGHDLTQTNDWILPDSGRRYYSEAELSGLSKSQLRIARNEIYARHGRTFSDPLLQGYFNSKSWYRGMYSPTNFDNMMEGLLNDFEQHNIAVIQKLEKKFN